MIQQGILSFFDVMTVIYILSQYNSMSQMSLLIYDLKFWFHVFCDLMFQMHDFKIQTFQSILFYLYYNSTISSMILNFENSSIWSFHDSVTYDPASTSQ